MPTLSTAEIRAAARAKAKAATEALPDLEAKTAEARAAHEAADQAERAARSALTAARNAENLCSATPSAAIALIRLVESAPHLIDALKAQRAKRIVPAQDHAALVRRRLVFAGMGQGAQLTSLTSLGAQVLRLHTEITTETPTTEDKQ